MRPTHVNPANCSFVHDCGLVLNQCLIHSTGEIEMQRIINKVDLERELQTQRHGERFAADMAQIGPRTCLLYTSRCV